MTWETTRPEASASGGTGTTSSRCRTASQLFLDVLYRRSVRHVFLVPGAHIDPLVEALAEHPEIEPILCAHETSAGYMADGYARASGQIGVVLSIGGPGAANLIPAASIARLEHSRVLFVTGNVPLRQRGRGGFQDGYPEGARDVELFATAAGWSRGMESSDEWIGTTERLLDDMLTGAVYSAHLSVPHDVQSAPSCPEHSRVGSAVRTIDCFNGIATLPHAVRTADPTAAINPVRVLKNVLEGVGHRVALVVGRPAEDAHEFASLVRAFAERYQIPVGTTQDAKGLFPESHPLSLGNFGFAGTRRAAELLLEQPLDALLWLGCCFNERNTLCWDERLWQVSRKILQIDSQAQMQSLPRRDNVTTLSIPAVVALRHWQADALSLPALEQTRASRAEWFDAGIKHLPSAESCVEEILEPAPSGGRPLHPGLVVTELRRQLAAGTRLCVDSGAHRQFASRYWRAETPDEYLTSATVASMGWAIAAGIGAQLAEPERTVVIFTGDGCLHMHGMELATAVRQNLPIAIVVSNNASLGNVSVRQQKRSPAAGKLSQLSTIDWAAFARSLGATARTVHNATELSTAFVDLHELSGPMVIDVHTSAEVAFPDPQLVPTCCVPPENVNTDSSRTKSGWRRAA